MIFNEWISERVYCIYITYRWTVVVRLVACRRHLHSHHRLHAWGKPWSFSWLTPRTIIHYGFLFSSRLMVCRVVWRWGVRLGWGQSPVRSVVLLKKEKLKNGKKGKWMKRKRTTHSVMWENYKMDFLVFFANFSLINMYETGDSDSLWFSRFAFMKIFCYFNIFHSFYNIDRVNWNFQLDINFSFLFLNHYDIFFIYKIDDIYFELGKLIVSILTSRSQQVSYNILSSV